MTRARGAGRVLARGEYTREAHRIPHSAHRKKHSAKSKKQKAKSKKQKANRTRETKRPASSNASGPFFLCVVRLFL